MGQRISDGHRGLTNGSFADARGKAAASPGGARAGRVNGLAEGPRRTSGLVNGLGRPGGLTNGVGRTNGLANPRGFTNGIGLHRNQLGIVPASDVRRGGALIAITAVLVLGLAIFLGTPAAPTSPFSVDGRFSEWAAVPMYTDPVDTVPAQADLVAYAVHVEPGFLFVYGKMRGPLFTGSEPSSVFIALDDPASSGYRIQGTEADYLIELWGWNGTLQGTALREWTGGPDRDNASALREVGSVAAAAVGPEFELSVSDRDIGFALSRDVRLTILSEADDQTDSSATVGKVPGALVLEERPFASVIGAPGPILELRLRALGAAIQVTNLTVESSGGGLLSLPPLPLSIPMDFERVAWIQIDPSGLPPGSFVTVRVTGAAATLQSASVAVPVTFTGDGARAYVTSEPVGYRIDGVFDDWTTTRPDANDSVRPSVDILASAVAVPSDSFYFVRTEGPIFAGAILPERHVAGFPEGNGSSSSPPLWIPRRGGEDLLRIYADTDDRDAVGFSIGGIVANRLIEVRGRAGRVLSTAVYGWNATTWEWTQRTEAFDFAFVGTRFEGMANASFLGPINNLRVVFAMTDWSGRGDITDLPTVPSPAAPMLVASSGPSPMHATLPDQIGAPELVNTPMVDGKCDSSPGEYTGAANGGNANLAFMVGRRNDTKFVYICLVVTADTTQSKSDYGEVIFDTLHNGGTLPQTDDRLFTLNGAGNTALIAWKGTGTGWNTVCGTSCDPGNQGASRFVTSEQYEFKIRYTDVWGTLTPSANQTAGFAIIANDNPGILYTWGGPSVSENVPNTWGHIFFGIAIPEFPTPALAAVGAIGIPLLWRRRTRRARVDTRDGESSTR